MSEKVIGYILLFSGVLLVVFSGVSVYQVFTSNAEPVQVFDFPPIGLSADQLLGGLADSPEAQAQLSQSNQEVELIPADVINQTSNLVAHMLLMGFLASIGTRIASIGVSLLRPIVVKMNDSHLQDAKKQVQKNQA